MSATVACRLSQPSSAITVAKSPYMLSAFDWDRVMIDDPTTCNNENSTPANTEPGTTDRHVSARLVSQR